jgi:hypothetical protein
MGLGFDCGLVFCGELLSGVEYVAVLLAVAWGVSVEDVAYIARVASYPFGDLRPPRTW